MVQWLYHTALLLKCCTPPGSPPPTCKHILYLNIYNIKLRKTFKSIFKKNEGNTRLLQTARLKCHSEWYLALCQHYTIMRMNNFVVQRALRQRSFRSVVVLFVPLGNIIVTTAQNNMIYYIFILSIIFSDYLHPVNVFATFPLLAFSEHTKCRPSCVGWQSAQYNMAEFSKRVGIKTCFRAYMQQGWMRSGKYGQIICYF